MSAWLVSKAHIDVLVHARTIAPQRTPKLAPDLTDDDLGRMLWQENMRSLQARYDDEIDEKALWAYTYEEQPRQGLLRGAGAGAAEVGHDDDAREPARLQLCPLGHRRPSHRPLTSTQRGDLTCPAGP